MASSSDKTVVVEELFFAHWDPATRTLRKTIMYKADVLAALAAANVRDGVERNIGNPHNFMKDIVRGIAATSKWPTRVADLRFTGEQRFGDEAIFEFIPFEPDQTEAFPDVYKFRPGDVPVFPVQSLGMLAESKMLGRRDEAWLTQVAVKLGIAETHFALRSPLRANVIDVIHLQMNMKLRRTEVDAAYMTRHRGPVKDTPVTGIITVEAKQANERVLVNQIVEQAKAALIPRTTKTPSPFAFVIPMAMRAVKNRGIYVAEFEHVTPAHISTYGKPKLVSEALYELNPPVPGI